MSRTERIALRLSPEELANLEQAAALSGMSMEEISETYSGKGYGPFKDAVADSVISALEPIQNDYERISADKAYLESVMQDGADRASRIAHKTMLKVRKKLGIAPLKL